MIEHQHIEVIAVPPNQAMELTVSSPALGGAEVYLEERAKE